MKLKPRTFSIQWNVHAWTGVVGSAVLFVMFYAGAFALYRGEIAVWQDPALHASLPDGSRLSFDRMLRGLEAEVAIPAGAHLGFTPRADRRFVSAWVSDPVTHKPRFFSVDSVSGAVAHERSRLADEMNALHFFEQVPAGRELSGVLSVAFLVVIASGLLIHLKDIRRQWWQFRPARRLRFSASDAHKVLGVFGLPFAAVLAWSGAALSIGGLVAAILVSTNFGGDFVRLATLQDPTWLARGTSTAPGPIRSLDEIVAAARASLGGADEMPSRLDVDGYGEAGGTVRVNFDDGSLGESPFAIADAQSGAILATSLAMPPPPSGAFARILFDLHFARFGDWLVQALYALLSLAVCAVIATGNLIWLERRDPRRERRGNRALARLTVGTMGGLVLASAAYVAANRALPEGLSSRPEREFWVFLTVWALAAGAAFVPMWPARRVGAALSLGAALVFGSVVLWDAVALDANLFTAPGRGLADVFAVELLLLGLALFCGGLARAMARSRDAVAGETDG